MKLKPENFYKPSEPKREDYKYHPEGYQLDDEFEIDETTYQVALSDWRKKHVKPEPESTCLNLRKPYENELIWSFDDGVGKWYSWIYWNGSLDEDPSEKYLTDIAKKEYDKALSYYNEHRVLFEGWELIKETKEFIFRKNKSEVVMNGFEMELSNNGKVIYSGAIPDETTFRSILKLNGIEP